MKTYKTRRAIFLVAFFFAVLLGMLCITGCPSTNQNAPPVGPVNGEVAPTYKAYVKGLVCPSCAVGLRSHLLKLPFVKAIHVNYKTGLVLIFEKQPRDKGSEKLDKLRITKVIEDSGYDVDRCVEDK